MNESSGRQVEAAGFVRLLVGSDVTICLDDRGFIMSEYSPLIGSKITNPLVGAFIKSLATPGQVVLVSESSIGTDNRRFIGRLRIDKHDKAYLRTATASDAMWLVSNDLTFAPHTDSIREQLGVLVEDAASGLTRLQEPYPIQDVSAE